MIVSIGNGFIAELELVSGNLFMEIFAADQAFRPIQLRQVTPANTETTSTVTFSDLRLFNGIAYFVRFMIESGGLFSGESDFLGFVPQGINVRVTENGDTRITENGDRRVLEN